jgi:hypothetical protein
VHRKSVCRKPEQVEVEPRRIPDNFHRLHKFVVLTANVMLINGIAFLITLSQKLQLATVEQLLMRTTTQLSSSLTKIIRLYACTGFIIHVIMMDQEFDKVKDTNEMVEISTTVAQEHVRKIKQYICTTKERSRALMLDLPFTVLPRQVAIHLVYFAVLWLNSLPAATGVSDKYSPHNIVLGRELDFTKHCKATFGSYVEAHDNPTITNTMCLCTFPGIFLGPTGNCQGTHKVFDINMGVVKKTRSITPLPMPDRVIKIVHDWDRCHQQEDKAKTLEFLNRKQQQYIWDNVDLKDDKGLVESDIAHPDIPAKFPSVHLESEQPQHHQVVKIIEESKENVSMLHNAMHPLMTSPNRMQECLPPSQSRHI